MSHYKITLPNSVKKRRKIGASLARGLELNADIIIHTPAMQCEDPDCEVAFRRVYGKEDRYCSCCGCELASTTKEMKEKNEILYDIFKMMLDEFGKSRSSDDSQ